MTDIKAQVAGLVFRVEDGVFKVLLVTSRDTHRWILPKGNLEKGMRPYQVAALEALEEAGVEGEPFPIKLATVDSYKRRPNGRHQPLRLSIYPVLANKQHDTWHEKGQRQIAWLTPGQAAMRVEEPALVGFLLALADERQQARLTALKNERGQRAA